MHAGTATGRRVGIPLGEAAARRRPQNDGLHAKSGFDFSASVAIDLATQRNFNNLGRLPGHSSLPFIKVAQVHSFSLRLCDIATRR
jgi:hypothetical protein